MARYCLIESGMASQSSPVSILFLARSLIFARLTQMNQHRLRFSAQASDKEIPILEPDLNGALRHVDLLGNPLPYGCGRSGVLVEFHLKGSQLILGSPLTLLILLLLRQCTLSIGTFQAVGRWCGRRRWGGGRQAAGCGLVGTHFE